MACLRSLVTGERGKGEWGDRGGGGWVVAIVTRGLVMGNAGVCLLERITRFQFCGGVHYRFVTAAAPDSIMMLLFLPVLLLLLLPLSPLLLLLPLLYYGHHRYYHCY